MGSWRQLQTACLHERIRHSLPGCSVRLPQVLECCPDPQPMKIEEVVFENQSLLPMDTYESTFFFMSQIFHFLLNLFLSQKSSLIIHLVCVFEAPVSFHQATYSKHFF